MGPVSPEGYDAKAVRKGMASAQKQANVVYLAHLVATGWLTASEGAQWFAVVDRTRSADSQVLAKLMLEAIVPGKMWAQHRS